MQKVFYFSRPIAKSATIEEETLGKDLITQAIQLYLSDPQLDKSLIKFPKNPEGLGMKKFLKAL